MHQSHFHLKHLYPRENSMARQVTFHCVGTQFYILSGPTLFACNTQWKCIGGLTAPPPPGCVRTKWKAPKSLQRGGGIMLRRATHNATGPNTACPGWCGKERPFHLQSAPCKGKQWREGAHNTRTSRVYSV